MTDASIEAAFKALLAHKGCAAIFDSMRAAIAAYEQVNEIARLTAERAELIDVLKWYVNHGWIIGFRAREVLKKIGVTE